MVIDSQHSTQHPESSRKEGKCHQCGKKMEGLHFDMGAYHYFCSVDCWDIHHERVEEQNEPR